MPSPQALIPTRRSVGRLLLIYLFDWIAVLGIIGFAGSTSVWVTPDTRPFSPNDITIQFPFQFHTKIPTWLLILCSIIMPGLAIAVLTLVLPSPSPSPSPSKLDRSASFTPHSSWISRRLYCLNTAWLGLGLAIAISMLVTNGVKNLVGRPRPDLISRCNIDESLIEQYAIGPGELLDWRVCRTHYVAKSNLARVLDEADLRDGFRSFPSGHCSMSFAGLTYLAIFLAEFVFALPLPHLYRVTPVSAPIVEGGPSRSPPRDAAPQPAPPPAHAPGGGLPHFPIMPAILISGLPLLLATYIATTRFSDYRHHTFDIFVGSALGITAGFVGWRWYGAWCCAGGEGRVYGLAAHMARRSHRRASKDVTAGEVGGDVDTDADVEDEAAAALASKGYSGLEHDHGHSQERGYRQEQEYGQEERQPARERLRPSRSPSSHSRTA